MGNNNALYTKDDIMGGIDAAKALQNTLFPAGDFNYDALWANLMLQCTHTADMVFEDEMTKYNLVKPEKVLGP